MRHPRLALCVGLFLALSATAFARPIRSPAVSAPPRPAPAPAATSATSSAKDSFEQSGSRQAAVQIKNWMSGYHKAPYAAGSGTMTAVEGSEALVLTAAHLFDEKVGPITVEFHDGQVSGGRILAIDPKLDVAALWIYAPKKIAPVPLGQHNPAIGQRVEVWGFGPRRFRSFLAELTLPEPEPADREPWLLAAQGIEKKQITIFGDSGGPMVREGKLVGVHWGYTNSEGDSRKYVRAVGCDKLREWLKGRLSNDLFQRCTGDSASAIE
jgi:hypothetical protein